MNGNSCNNWLLSVNNVPVISVCANDTSVFQFRVYSGRTVLIMFGDIVAMPNVPVSVPPQCFQPPPVCQQGSWHQLTFYRLHSWIDTALGQRNFATMIGDFAYICPVLLAGNSAFINNQTVISQWQMMVNTTWGQYALCNRDLCVGGDNVTVGREAAMGVGANGGQCVR